MPDAFDRELEQLLKYSDPAKAESFIMEVMRGVRRERFTRNAILCVFGLIGALFGLVGAVMLAGPLGSLLTFSLELPAMETMQISLALVGAAAFYLWFMNDDFSLGR